MNKRHEEPDLLVVAFILVELPALVLVFIYHGETYAISSTKSYPRKILVQFLF